MNRITVSLSEREAEGLVKLSQQYYRHPREQLRFILRQELNRQGILSFMEGTAGLEVKSLEQEIGNAAALPKGGSHDQV